MQKSKKILNVVTEFTGNIWTILVKVAEIVAGVQLFQCGEVGTLLGDLPLAQILGAMLVADVVIFVYSLLTNRNGKEG